MYNYVHSANNNILLLSSSSHSEFLVVTQLILWTLWFVVRSQMLQNLIILLLSWNPFPLVVYHQLTVFPSNSTEITTHSNA